MKKSIRTVIYRCARNLEPNLNKQKEDLITYAQDANLKVIGDFSDNAAVYKLDDRLQLRQLIRAARRREFDCVLIWKFTFFAASIPHLLNILKEFMRLDIRFISVQDNIDTKGEMGNDFIAALQLIIKVKAALIKERTKEGLQTARLNGKKLGRPATPVPADVVKIVEELAATTNLTIRKIREETGKRLTYQVTRDIIYKVRNQI